MYYLTILSNMDEIRKNIMMTLKSLPYELINEKILFFKIIQPYDDVI